MCRWGIVAEVGHGESDRTLQTRGLEAEARMDTCRPTWKGNHVPRYDKQEICVARGEDSAHRPRQLACDLAWQSPGPGS